MLLPCSLEMLEIVCSRNASRENILHGHAAFNTNALAKTNDKVKERQGYNR